MGKSCIYKPIEANGETNHVFEDALKLTGNRDIAKMLYGMSKSPSIREAHGFTDSNISFYDFADAINIQKYISQEDYCKYLTEREQLANITKPTLYDSLETSATLVSKYDDVVPSITKNTEGYNIAIVPKTSKAVDNYKNTIKLNELNDRLLTYLHNLGFTAVYNETTESYFDPMNATQNANNLKEIISLAKNRKGQVDLPEEFSHFLSIAFQEHPLAQRLKNLMTDDIVKDILGEDYDKYKKRYSESYNPSEMLQLEAMGKLLAQSIVDKYVNNTEENTIQLDNTTQYVSQKYTNALLNALAKGNENAIGKMIIEATQVANDFIADIFDNEESINFFTPEKLEHVGRLYSIETDTAKLDKAIDDIISVYAKRIKLLTLKREKGELKADEIKTLESLKKAKREKEYDKGCIKYLQYCLDDCKGVLDNLKTAQEKFKTHKDFTIGSLRFVFKNINDVSNIVTAYNKVTSAISQIRKDYVDQMSEENKQQIIDLSSEVNSILFELNEIQKEMQVSTLTALFKPYWKDGIIRNGEKVPLSLQDVLQSSVGDITGFSRMINSMSDMADPFLQMSDMLYKDICHDRDLEILKIKHRIAQIHEEYVNKTGSKDTSFIYVKNSNGKPTGYIKSEYDYTKYYQAYKAKKEELKKQFTFNGKVDYDSVNKEMRTWEYENQETLTWEVPGKLNSISERVPRKDLYGSDDLKTLTAAQKEYYNEWIQLKKEMDALIGKRYTKLFRAPQKQIDTKEAILQGKNVKGILKRERDNFVQSINDTEYGYDGLDENGKYTITDIAGNPIKRVPVYYNVYLGSKNMDMLDTNASDVLLSYSAMAVNYKHMNAAADAFDTILLQFRDRDIKKVVGKQKLFDRFKLTGDVYQSDLTIKGSETEEYKKLLNYIDANIYGRRKENEQLSVGKFNINAGKMADVLKMYSTHLGLGFNIFSATTNASMGVLQNILIAVGHDYFGNNIASSMKNLLTSTHIYNSLMPSSVLESYNDVKKNRLNLLIERFDLLDDVYRETVDGSFNLNGAQKVTKKANPMFGMSAGEHLLHCIPAIAILRNQKVLVNGVESSLYDALIEKEVTQKLASGKEYKITKLALKDGTTNLDGTKFTEDDLIKVKRIIHESNNKAHGAYSEIDKGDAHRKALGRLLLQFRQWMPAFYFNRFSGERVNMKTGETEEGYYRTAIKFILGSYHDKEMQAFHLVSNWNKLTKRQKKAVRQASVETALFYIICMLLTAMGKPDQDDPAFLNMLKYNLYRLRTELGGAVPSIYMADSFLTLFKTPMPVINNMDTMFDLFRFSDIGRTIQSGKYEGWNKWGKTVYKTIPYVGDIVEAYDFTQGEIDKLKPYIS